MAKPVLADLRRQILEDVLGEHVEEYENFDKHTVAENRRPHRQRIPLWQFLLHLLRRDKQAQYIKWNTDCILEFRILDTVGVAALWGSVKNKTDMTYEKLGRAMRYYYGKSIIEKVSGRRYTYRFILSRRTKKYLSQFMMITEDMLKDYPDSISEHNTIEEENDSCGDSVVPDSRPGTPEELDSESLVPSPTRYESVRSTTENQNKKHREAENKKNKDKLSVEMKQIQEPLKSDSHQTFMKTKIFKPEELIGRKFPGSLAPNLNDFYESRRSAFVAPIKKIKSADSCKTKIFRAMPMLERICTYDDVMFNGSRKRKLVCSCGDPSCSGWSDEISFHSVSECGVSIHGKTPLQRAANKEKDYSQHSSNRQSVNDDFFLRREIIEKQEQNLQTLQHKLQLQRRADPFMGFDIYRFDTDYERHDNVYDAQEEYAYETNHGRHAWVV